jgi:hypothetical protein
MTISATITPRKAARASRTPLRSAVVGTTVAVVALSLCTRVHANFKSLAQRLPASANAIIAINVEKVLQTPYAQKEWLPTAADAWARQPVMIPSGAKRLLMAAEVRTDNMEPFWEMSLVEMDKVPDLKLMAAKEGGHIDRVWDKDAVASPINAYFVPLDATTLASITPANRAAIAKWVRTPTTRPEGNMTSDYLQRVAAGLGDKTDIVMAMDLEGAFGVPRIRRWLDENDIKEIPEKQRDEAARTLGTMKGITLVMTVGQDVTGRGTVEFDRDASALAAGAKPIMLGVLSAAGMRIDDIEQWNFAAAGKQVTMEGKLSTPALRKLLGIVQSPIPAATADPAAAKPAGDVPTDPVQASQRYFKVICANLDNLKVATSPTESAQWARATSKRIDQLPILNVDPELVKWGSMVSLKLKQVGAGMATAQTAMNSRVAGVADPAYTTYTDNEGFSQSTINQSEVENAKRQRRQVALEQRAQAQEQAVQILTEIAESRPAVRAAMVEKYKVEF